MKKIIALLLVLAMALTLVACGSKPVENKPEQTQPQAGNDTPVEPTNNPDTIVIMAPPVTGEYLNNLKVWAADFNKIYPAQGNSHQLLQLRPGLLRGGVIAHGLL